ncbi:MAG: hypothetical protein JL56_07695 [Desulfotomaculum sp. BICA1-6]|nr:MAG: hypothetical protein JL56_07695 [Desulfotomaculum sp. BICA1-6]
MKAGASIYVIGLGNELAGDDGVGVAVLNRLQEQGSIPPGVKLIEAGIPGLSLVELMLGAKQVILVDSFLDGGNSGMVRRFTEQELPPVGYSAGQSHGIGLREALAFARGVMPQHFPGEVVVVGIAIERPGRWVQGLSPPVKAAVEQAAETVRAEVLRCMKSL